MVYLTIIIPQNRAINQVDFERGSYSPLHLPPQGQLPDELFHHRLQQGPLFVPAADDLPYLGIEQTPVLEVLPRHKRLVILVLYRHVVGSCGLALHTFPGCILFRQDPPGGPNIQLIQNPI